MKPLYLYINDFMGYGETKLNLTELKSATLIVGIEDGSKEKSNAVGKTTLFSAIRYALFNVISTSKDNVIRRGCKKCKVIFEFELSNGNIYRIIRTRTKSTADVTLYILENSNWSDISQRTPTQTDKAIVEIIGVNKNTFENTSYFKQKDLFNIASATKEQRKSIIMDMLQLDDWDKYEDAAKDKRDSISEELKVVDISITKIGDPSKDIKDIKNAIVFIDSSIESKNTEVETLKLELNELNSKLETAKQEYSNEYPELLKAFEAKKAEIQKLCREHKILSENNARKQQELSFKQTELSLKEDKLSKAFSLLKTYEEEINNATCPNVDFQKLSSEIADLSAIIDKKRSEGKLLEKNLPDDEYCDRCGTSLDADHRKILIEDRQKRANIITNELVDLNSKLIEIKSEKRKADNDLNIYNSLVGKKIALDTEIKGTTSIINTLKEIIVQLSSTIESNIEDICNKEKLVEASTNDMTAIQLKINSFNHKEKQDNINELMDKISTLQNKIKVIGLELNTLIYTKGKEANRLEIRINDLQELGNLLYNKTELEYQLKVSKVGVSVFSSSGVRTMIINSVLDSLQSETNKVLETLRPGIQIQFIVHKENSNGNIIDTLDMKFFVNGDEWEYGSLSGGQQACVDLALKFAMAVVNRRRCGADIKMLMLDEVDQAIDIFGLKAFINVLNIWDDDMVIFVITHNEMLKEMFNSFIVVNRKNRISTAEVNVK